MRILLITALLIGVQYTFGQTTANSTPQTMATAKYYLKKNSYAPEKSFAIYTKFAQQGNAEAMNALGVMYSKGIGTSIDEQQAITWFTQACQNKYGNAFYNLGMIYKHALGTTQDFVKAYQLFQQGAALNNNLSTYAVGYMLFKGLGCHQSYEQAVKVFKKCVTMHELGSMYMLGICYRNGYGIAVNLDSANYWLNRSAKGGYPFAPKELATAQPENASAANDIQVQPVTVNDQVVTPNLKAGFQTIRHHLPPKNISGNYVGYAIKFDWSGKHVIGQSKLNLKLERKAKTLTGTWTENGVSTSIEASLTDTAVVFNNTSYSMTDHYNIKSPNDLQFKNAQMQLVSSTDTVFITGNLQLYSTDHQEPEKPTFIMLMRTSSNARDTSGIATLSAKTKVDSVHFVMYPNPFTTTLHARFTLKHACKVRLFVSNAMNANVVYSGDVEQLQSGDYTRNIQLQGPPGTYVCTLNYGDQLQSAIVFKN